MQGGLKRRQVRNYLELIDICKKWLTTWSFETVTRTAIRGLQKQSNVLILHAVNLTKMQSNFAFPTLRHARQSCVMGVLVIFPLPGKQPSEELRLKTSMTFI